MASKRQSRRPQEPPRRLQDASKSLREPPRCRQDAHAGRQKASFSCVFQWFRIPGPTWRYLHSTWLPTTSTIERFEFAFRALSRLRLTFDFSSIVDVDLFDSLISVPPQGAALGSRCRLISTYPTYLSVSEGLTPPSRFAGCI